MRSELSVKYKLELLCDYPEWWRFNVYVIAVGYDSAGGRVAFNDLTDRVYDMDYGEGERTAPEGFSNGRKIELTTDPSHHLDIYIYAVTNTFPTSRDIKDSPPFNITLKVNVGQRLVEKREFEVNQWGGLTVVAHRVGPVTG